MQSRDSQYKHAVRKKESELARLKERLHTLLIDSKTEMKLGMCFWHFTPSFVFGLYIYNFFSSPCTQTVNTLISFIWIYLLVKYKGKGKVFPYSLPSVGPGADPGVQAVSPQVT